MEDLYSEIVKTLEKKERAALATLISRIGSAPRAVGAKYLVKEDGISFGTIGGGCVEAEVWQGAQETIKKGKAGVLHFDLTAEQLAAGGLICGGTVDIFLEPLREDFLDIYREVARIKQKGGSALLATLVSVDHVPSEGNGIKVLMKPSGEKIGRLAHGEGLELKILTESEATLREMKPRTIGFSWENKKMEILLEPIVSEPTVYIFGAGHISQQLAPIAKMVQFKVVVFDDREVFANRDRFPEADEVIVSEFERCFDRLTIDESSYIVIVTRGHLYDGFVLEQAIKTGARYIGMIGSRSKIQILYKNLMKKGVSKEALDRVCAPIGLDINSETPEEIAVSIAAELIKVRGENPLSRGHLREKKG
jgi:xanthine dehydrogenase accessory factor